MFSMTIHYENLSIHYTKIFKVLNNENFQQKFLIFLIILLKT